MIVDEPKPEDVERAVRTLKLTLALVNSDPLARGGRAMIEAFYGRDIEKELENWLRNPKEKVELRNKFISRMVEIWRSPVSAAPSGT
jgi:hypothetical protein